MAGRFDARQTKLIGIEKRKQIRYVQCVDSSDRSGSYTRIANTVALADRANATKRKNAWARSPITGRSSFTLEANRGTCL